MYKFINSSSKSKLIPLLSYSTLYKSARLPYSSNWVSSSRNEISNLPKFLGKDSRFFPCGNKSKIETWNGNGSWVLGGQSLVSGVRSYSSESDREAINYDVVIVGAGPAGLSAAIRLKQLCQQKDADLSVCVVEKGAEVGAHILSGNVFEPRALNELFPRWKEEEAPVDVPVTSDNFCLLSENRAFSLPSPFDNNGNYVISLSQLVRWLGQKAEELGVEIYPGFAASEILCNKHNEVTGIATNDMGVAKDGSRKENYQRGVALKGRVTLLAEGCRGSLSEKLIKKYNLREKGQGQHQTYALGIKEVWEIDADKHQPGSVLHTLGWPLDHKSYGGSFLYHMKDRQVAVGLVVALNYQNPFLNPYEEYQRFKRHPAIRPLLEGGTVLQYGARCLNEGGFQSIPYPVFPGGAIIGCSAGFLNVPKIKGTHTAMKSGTPFTALAPLVFKSESYHIWAARMEAHMEANDLWEAVEEDYGVPPLPTNPTMAQIRNHKEKKTRKSKARATLFAAVSSEIFVRIMTMKSAFEVWNFLKKEYEGDERIKGMRILNLIREFELQKMKESETVKEYSDRLLNIANNVRLLGSEFSNSRLVQKILVTVVERFEATISSLENSNDLSKISLAELLNSLQARIEKTYEV